MYDDQDGNVIECPSCQNTDLRRAGVMSRKQRYQCKACEKYFFPKPPAKLQKQRIKHKLTILLYAGGAQIKDVQEITGNAYATIKSRLAPIIDYFETDKALKAVRRHADTQLIMTDSISDIPNLKKKTWLLIELPSDALETKIVAITRQNPQ